MVVTSIMRFFVNGSATPASHSWKWAITAFFFSRQTNCKHVSTEQTKNHTIRTYLAKEPSDEIAKDDGVIGLVVVVGRWNGGNVPEVRFPFILVVAGRLEVKQKHARGTLDEPSPVDDVDAAVL